METSALESINIEKWDSQDFDRNMQVFASTKSAKGAAIFLLNLAMRMIISSVRLVLCNPFDSVLQVFNEVLTEIGVFFFLILVFETCL